MITEYSRNLKTRLNLIPENYVTLTIDRLTLRNRKIKSE